MNQPQTSNDSDMESIQANRRKLAVHVGEQGALLAKTTELRVQINRLTAGHRELAGVANAGGGL